MSCTDSYRLVYSLMLIPDRVFLVTIGNDRWMTDRRVLLNLTPFGVRYDFPEDGCYSLRRSQPAKPESLSRAERNALGGVAAAVSQFEKVRNWRPVRATPWGVADGPRFARLLERQDSKHRTANSWIDGALLAAWEDALTGWQQDITYEQPAGKSVTAIRVRLTKPYGTHVSGKPLISTNTVGYLMPIKRSNVPAFPESVRQVPQHTRPGGDAR